MIIVVSHPEDPHAARVLGHLRDRQSDALLLNVGNLPEHATLTFDYANPGRPRLEYQPTGSAPTDLGNAHAVWWRRPQVANTAALFDANTQLFAAGEWHEAVSGLWQLLDARWMNPPPKDELASRKAYQLMLASQLGLRVPRTLMTSDPSRARAFIEREGLGRTVFKTFSCTYAIWCETRIVREEELRNLESVRLAPVIFQEYIPAAVDLRITIVGDEIFAAAIAAKEGDYPYDFRMVLGASTVEPVVLPMPLQAQLRALMRRLGLVYGAIDMRRTPAGEFVFLEVNTAGEFLFIEERTGLPIAQAIAGWLRHSPDADADPRLALRRNRKRLHRDEIASAHAPVSI